MNLVLGFLRRGKSSPAMSKIDPRDKQMLPKLSPREIDRLRRFGEVRRYAPREPLFITGEVAPGMFVLDSGFVRVTRRDPLGHLAPTVEQRPVEFVAEIGQLSGRLALVDVHSAEDPEVLFIPPERLRTLIITEPNSATGSCVRSSCVE
jgi:thioredoxin reductase (NADPH)